MFRPTRAKIALLVWAVLLAVVCIKPLFAPYSSTVYITYATAGEEFAAGRRLYGVEHPHTDNFRYLPVVAAGFAPASVLPPGVGSAIWRLLGAALFLGGMAAWARRLQPDLALPLLFLFSIPLSIGSLNNAQANTHIVGLMLWASVLASRGKWTLAAVLIAAAALFKGYPIALGGLLLLLAPLRFGLPLLLSLAVGIALPYAFQSADYVTAQYQFLFENLQGDDRSGFPLPRGYQDFHMLLRVLGVNISRSDFAVVQAGTGLAAAGLLLWLRRRGMNRSDAALNAFTLGICWMCLFGPAVEASTFILMAPMISFELLAARSPRWARIAAWAGAGLFLTSVLVFAFPHSVHQPVIAVGILPSAALLLSLAAIGRLISVRQAQPAIAFVEPLRQAA